MPPSSPPLAPRKSQIFFTAPVSRFPFRLRFLRFPPPPSIPYPNSPQYFSFFYRRSLTNLIRLHLDNIYVNKLIIMSMQIKYQYSQRHPLRNRWMVIHDGMIAFSSPNRQECEDYVTIASYYLLS